MSAGSVSSAVWGQERKRWQNFYRHHLENRLAWAVEFARSTPPEALRRHLPSLLSLLEEAQRRDAPPSQVAALIMALHPWPLRWGYWAVWEMHLMHLLTHAPALSPARRALFRVHLGDIMQAAGRNAEAEEAFARAFSLAAEARDAVVLAEAGFHWVCRLVDAERIEDAFERLRFTERLVQAWGMALSPAQKAVTQAYLALAAVPVLRRQEKMGEASHQVQRAIRGLRNLATPPALLLARLHTQEGVLRWEMEDFGAAESSLREALRLYRGLQDRFAEAETLGDLGLVYWSTFALDEAEKHLLQSLRISERLNARGRMSVEVGNLALVYLVRGNLSLAEEYLRRQQLLAEQSGYMHEFLRARGNLALVYTLRGEYQRAIVAWEKQRAHERANHMFRAWAVSDLYLGLGYALSGYHAEGLAFLREALDLAVRLDSGILLGLGLRAQAVVSSPQDARFFLRRALEIARRYQRPFDEAACLLWQAKFEKDAAVAGLLWERGKTILARLQAVSWLEGHDPKNPPVLPFLR